jgi:hypothetical protein
MTAPAVAVTVGVHKAPQPAADRVLFEFGDRTYELSVEDAVILVNHTLAAIETLRPQAVQGTVQ